MATMLPREYDSSTVSSAERKLFELLKHDPDPANWVVLHSLGLSSRGNKPYGEIDFVVLIPSGGIFCLEVKGGGISCSGGVWKVTNRYGKTEKLKRSPFMQAREGMFALRKALLPQMPRENQEELVFGYAVVFPDIIFNEESTEWEAWQVIDHESLKETISGALKKLSFNMRNKHKAGKSAEPTAATLKKIQQALRPDFEVVITRGVQIEKTEERLLRLTHEQFETLDLISDNERCLFEGAAGTGKTMLALEYARRSTLSGKRTLLICYNRILGDWLTSQVITYNLGNRLIAGRYFKILRDLIIRSSFVSEFCDHEKCDDTNELFGNTYPYFGQLAIDELDDRFDVVIMDEAQDLIRKEVLDVVNCCLKGGLKDGMWAIFGDFERQAIFRPITGDQIKALLKEYTSSYAKGKLTLNCRNTKNIGEETALISGFKSSPCRMSSIPGPPVDYRYYSSKESEQEELYETITRFMQEDVRPEDIVVLSKFKYVNSGISGIDGGKKFRLIEMNNLAREKSRIPVIPFITAQAFKGMESPVVILCDIDQISDDDQSLLYVAMSRARSQLTVLLHEQSKKIISERIMKKLKENLNHTYE